jgi:hypothetical protein
MGERKHTVVWTTMPALIFFVFGPPIGALVGSGIGLILTHFLVRGLFPR